MKIAKAWVQVEIEIAEDEGLIGTQRDDRLIAELVKGDHVTRATVFRSPHWQDAPKPPAYFCGCGESLSNLSEPCWKCEPEQAEWTADDQAERARSL